MEQILYIGRKLKEMWKAKLNRDFPNRNITVRFYEEDSDNLLDYNITFYQEKQE